jgi:hypothetical protein
VAGEDWTFPSRKGWDDTNLAMFINDVEASREVVENTFQRAEELGVKQIAITE